MDMAEAVMDKIEKKVEKSKGKARKVQERAKAWEELNKSVLTAKTHNGGALEVENFDDAEMQVDVKVGDDPTEELPVAPRSIPELESTEDDDEIL